MADSCVGYHMSLDFRTLDPKPFMEIFPTTIPIDQIDHRVMLDNEQMLRPPGRPRVADYPRTRASYETASPMPLSSFGLTGFTRLVLQVALIISIVALEFSRGHLRARYHLSALSRPQSAWITL